MIDVKIIRKPKKGTAVVSTGGFATVGNDNATGSTAKEAAYARRAGEADLAQRALEANHADRATEADHAAKAADLDADSPANDRFIHKDQADRTPYALSVGGTLTAEDSIQSKEYQSGMDGFGWGGDKKGNFSFESIEVRSFMRLLELIVNRQRTMDADIMLSEGDTIESVTPLGNSTEGNPKFTLKMKEEWDGYTTALYELDVIRGVYNDISSSPATGAGTTTKHGATYYTSWMRVLAVRPGVNEVDVVVYPDSETPANRNFPPSAMMAVSRWGNAGESVAQKMRQSVIVLSSTEKCIKILDHVTKPIIGKGNIAATFGSLPDFLAAMDSRIKPGDMGIYARTGVLENLFMHDYQGLPEPEIVYRGEYDPTATYYNGTVLRPDTQKYEKSCVGHLGCLWLNNVTGTANPPAWDSTDWSFYQGDPRLELTLIADADAVDADDPQLTLEATASLYNQDITSDPQLKWDWSRETSHNGVTDTASDATWNAAHENTTNTITLTRADMNYAFGEHPETCIFTVTATLIDSTTGNPVTYDGKPMIQKKGIKVC